jgi:mersacidin/lichenicidin family type 2 lantibiotic
MSMEEVIRAWKADEEALEPHLPASPVGRALSEEELQEIDGGTCTLSKVCLPDGFTCFFLTDFLTN